MLKVGLYTLGCKVSQYETQAIAESFLSEGFLVADFSDECDAYVINTCTVTRESDRKSRQIIRRAIAKNPSAVVAVLGCYSQRSPSEVIGIDGVDIVIGTENKLSVVERVKEALAEKQSGEEPKRVVSVTDLSEAGFEPMKITGAERTRAYVKIEDGCDSKCTYCAIKEARGRIRSKPKEDVIAEVEALYSTGIREIVLTGIETGSYGKDFDTPYGLADLIAELSERGSAERIRLGSLAPELIGEDFVKKVSGSRILAPHFHLSVQSGSDSVLRRMKRRYNRNTALENIKRLRENIEGCQFTTDLMVGFPGESEEDFLDTVAFVKEARFIDAHVFAYSMREGTPAALFEGQIDESVKRRRSAELIRVVKEVREEVLEEIISSGRTLHCILETLAGDVFTAHSAEFAVVILKADGKEQGDFVKVRPVSHKDGIIYGELIEE